MIKQGKLTFVEKATSKSGSEYLKIRVDDTPFALFKQDYISMGLQVGDEVKVDYTNDGYFNNVNSLELIAKKTSEPEIQIPKSITREVLRGIMKECLEDAINLAQEYLNEGSKIGDATRIIPEIDWTKVALSLFIRRIK
ncbi:hypothetical protein DRN69_08675 [Candidatus Pacearchaeota archaeon]|nr:MAG: hypothetical protein DRN69_08675 [Candidatus Pacearchaeota archaeon]